MDSRKLDLKFHFDATLLLGCDGTFPIFVSEAHLQENPNMQIYILIDCINSDGKLLMVFLCRLLLLL